MVESLGSLVLALIEDTYPKEPPASIEQRIRRIWKIFAFYEALWIMRMIDEKVLPPFPPITDKDLDKTETHMKENRIHPGNFAGTLYRLTEQERRALFVSLMKSGFNWKHLDSYVLGGIYETYLSDVEMLSGAWRKWDVPWARK